MISSAKDRLIVALDVPSIEEARAMIDRLQDSVGVYKLGLELLFSGGLSLASELAARGDRAFIDAKLLDIETTVERATAAIARTGAEFLTVHALDCKTLDAAVRGRAGTGLKLLGVTVLTNLDRDDLKEQGVDRGPQELAVYRAMLAQEAGFDGSPRRQGRLPPVPTISWWGARSPRQLTRGPRQRRSSKKWSWRFSALFKHSLSCPGLSRASTSPRRKPGSSFSSAFRAAGFRLSPE